MLDVIEHCVNPGLALRNVADIIEDRGILVLTVPNPKWSRARLELLYTGFLSCFTEGDLEINHHVFTPWPHILGKLLCDAGFDVLEYATIDGWTKPLDRTVSATYPLRVASAVLMRAIELRDPSACGMSYGLVAQRMAR